MEKGISLGHRSTEELGNPEKSLTQPVHIRLKLFAELLQFEQVQVDPCR